MPGFAGEFQTSAADYFDVSVGTLSGGEAPEQFFLVGFGDDDDIFNLQLP